MTDYINKETGEVVTLPGCTLDDIVYVERQYHTYPVDPDGNAVNLADEYPTVEPDCHPYSCGRHGLDFRSWPEVLEHLADPQKSR